MPDDHQPKPQVAQTELRIRSCGWKSSGSVKTDLVPNTGNIEMIERITSMIISLILDCISRLFSIREGAGWNNGNEVQVSTIPPEPAVKRQSTSLDENALG